MTLGQAYEHTRWDLRLEMVVEKYSEPRVPCSVCDNAWCYGSYAVFKDRETYDTFHVVVCLCCKWALEKVLDK